MLPLLPGIGYSVAGETDLDRAVPGLAESEKGKNSPVESGRFLKTKSPTLLQEHRRNAAAPLRQAAAEVIEACGALKARFAADSALPQEKTP